MSSSSRLRRIKNELSQVQNRTQQPPHLTFTESNNSGVVSFTFSMNETSSPYHGATFNIEVTFPEGYPLCAPTLFFKNPIPYHFLIDPNNGQVVGLDKLSNWAMSCTILSIFEDLYSKLVHLPTFSIGEEPCSVNEDMLTEFRVAPHLYIEKAKKSVVVSGNEMNDVTMIDGGNAWNSNSGSRSNNTDTTSNTNTIQEGDETTPSCTLNATDPQQEAENSCEITMDLNESRDGNGTISEEMSQQQTIQDSTCNSMIQSINESSSADHQFQQLVAEVIFTYCGQEYFM